MKLFLVVIGLAAVAQAAPKYEPILIDYHNAVGIPEAARIKAAEEAMDFDGSRITGGSSAKLGQFPHMAGLIITLTDGRQSVCGSSLVSQTRIVTAAHCWRSIGVQAREFNVVLGSIRLFSGGTRIKTNKVEVHKDYNMVTLRNDVAIGTISKVSLNQNIKPIALATGNDNYVNKQVTAAGFGKTGDGPSGDITSNQGLSYVNLKVMPNADCSRVYGSLTVASSTLCVVTNNGKSTCGGDSGGPLSMDNNAKLVGITSFGHRDGCKLGYPAGFARVTSFASWFKARM